MTTIAAIALALAAPATAAAEGSDPAPADEQVLVREALPEGDDPVAFETRLPAEELRERGRTLADLLRRVPGARVRDYGGIGGYATMSLRGSTSEQVTVLVDGVPQNRALGGPVDLSSIPATQIESVRVYRGFAPATFGLGGIGGLVDIRTRDTDGEIHADALAGGLGTARLTAGGTVDVGAGALRLGLEALAADGDFEYLDTGGTLFDPSDDRAVRRRNNEVEQRTLTARYRRELDAAGDLGISLRVTDRERGVPGVDGFPSASARTDERGAHLVGAWERRPAGKVRRLAVRASAFAERIEFTDREGEVGVAAQDRTTRLAGAAASASASGVAGRHRWLVRAELDHERAALRDRALDRPDRGGARRARVGLTAQDESTWGRTIVVPALRLEHRRDDFRASADGTVPPPARDVERSDWSARLGMGRTLSQQLTLRGSIGRFHRAPSLLELFGDRGSVAGNPGLRAERGLSAELGVAGGSKASSGTTWEAVAFARRADDLIRLVPASQGTAVARNIGRADVWGVETDATLRRPWGLELAAGLTWQRGVDRSGGFADGEPLPYQPEWLGYAGVGWEARGFALRWDLSYTGENPTTVPDTPAFRLPERFVHDAHLGYRSPRGWRVGLDVRNAFDRRTRDVARYPLPGRVVLLGLGWSRTP